MLGRALEVRESRLELFPKLGKALGLQEGGMRDQPWGQS